MLVEDINFEDIYFRPNKKQFSDFNSNFQIEINSDRENNVSIGIENLIIEKVAKIAKEKDSTYLPDTEKYFSEDEVKFLIIEFQG